MIKSKQMQQRCNSTKGWCRSCSYAPRRNSHSLILTAKGYTYTKQSNPLVQKFWQIPSFKHVLSTTGVSKESTGK